MKNIAPISPPEQIVPEPMQVPAVPLAQTALPAAAQPPPAPAANPIAVPVAAAADKPFNQAPESLYPNPLTSEERVIMHQETYRTPGNLALSQYLIPLVVGVYALQSIWSILKAITKDGVATGLTGSFMFGGSGRASAYAWLLVIVTLLQLVVLAVAAYKVFRASRLGLGIISGAALMLLPQTLASYVLLIPDLSYLVKDVGALLHVIGAGLLTVMLVLAWTKDKRQYV